MDPGGGCPGRRIVQQRGGWGVPAQRRRLRPIKNGVSPQAEIDKSNRRGGEGPVERHSPNPSPEHQMPLSSVPLYNTTTKSIATAYEKPSDNMTRPFMRRTVVAPPQDTSRLDLTAGAHLLEPMPFFRPPALYASHYNAGHSFSNAWNGHTMSPTLPFIYNSMGSRAGDIVNAGCQPYIQPQTTWPPHVQDYNSFTGPHGFPLPAQPQTCTLAMNAAWKAPIFDPGDHAVGSKIHYEARVPQPREIA